MDPRVKPEDDEGSQKNAPPSQTNPGGQEGGNFLCRIYRLPPAARLRRLSCAG